MPKDADGHFAKKHPFNSNANSRVVNALKQKASEGEVPCAVAFKIASELGVTPEIVGQTTDLLEFRLAKCQMGLFGYKPNKRIVKPAEVVSKELEACIRQGLKNNRQFLMPCKKAWEIKPCKKAEKLGLRKMAVSSACEALGIKINACQLGAFK